MKRYEDYKSIDDVVWTKFRIIVPTEEDKKELQEAFEHLHDADIDADNVPVNELVHQYLDDNGCYIIVDKELYEQATRH
jgi:L-lysine 2,3-aminomutase